MRAAVYARVSTFDQEPENQLAELRRYGTARGWTLQEYIDRGVSGAKDRRPALDTLLADARRRRFDVLVVWRLDRLGRNLRHLITLLEELQALGIAFVSLNEGITISATSTTKPVASSRLKIRLRRKCYLWPRNEVLPMRPEWTGQKWRARQDSNLRRPA